MIIVAVLVAIGMCLPFLASAFALEDALGQPEQVSISEPKATDKPAVTPQRTPEENWLQVPTLPLIEKGLGTTGFPTLRPFITEVDEQVLQAWEKSRKPHPIPKDFKIVNKVRALPADYAPGEDPKAAKAVRELIAAARKAGLDISDDYSGYRDYQHQAGLYNLYVEKYGKDRADTFSARPGHSEHQTGQAFDLKSNSGELLGVVDGKRTAYWVAHHAHEFGFIVRYQTGKEAITGYRAEPWHLRYVGAEATKIYRSGLTLEEYYGVKGGNYAN
ncbi:hypothetical protein BK816_02645 [Boudabousia tangfeifanii]|uniref:D-alanyl-D-alanine carboxypeptidase-like core domain-containing protein n=2 Tax=Boudabousia tangfeifanii TaxID=1912795 RepID=A0A1D9MJG7_9ACTO|nr:hypothetical protein BK816_02645 [Boudabousia tangfeifanii]